MHKDLFAKRASYAVPALERAYETILGEKERLANAEYGMESAEEHDLAFREWKRTVITLDNLLEALETTIKLFHPQWDRRSMKPKVRRLSRNLAGVNAIVNSMFEVMRAVKSPLTVADIAERIAKDLGLKRTIRDQRRRHHVAVTSALSRYEEKGLVKRIHGKPNKWVLA